MVDEHPFIMTPIRTTIKDSRQMQYFKICYHDTLELKLLKDEIEETLKKRCFPVRNETGWNE